MNKTPVFRGPSGRQKKSPMPKIGDYLELVDGKRYRILEMRGDQARVETSNGMRWADVNERIMYNNPLKQTSFEDAIRESEAREFRTGHVSAFKTERLPLTYDTVMGLGVAGPQTVDHFKEKMRHRRQEIARMARKAAAEKRVRKYHRGLTSEKNATYDRDVRTVSSVLREGIRLEKPQGSSLHHFLDYNQGEIEGEWFKRDWQSFIIEHDWAKAFDNVDGFNDDGDIVMPFTDMVFEMRISGLRVLVFISEDKGSLEGLVCTGVDGRWYVNAEKFQFKGGRIIGMTEMLEVPDTSGIAEQFLRLLNAQIRAVCIMLDSDVAEAEQQPVSPALNKARRRSGRTELKPYHIVRLHRKHRERGERSEATGRRVRCHYRRGHWRHYELPSSGDEQVIAADGILRSRTWINWMLVGDIDLGFVDKEYRL